MNAKPKSSGTSKWRVKSFFRSSLQRRLVVMIFCMAVFPILLSSIIGNFWFQRTLKKSTVREFKLSNELISQRIESELRFIQETVGFAFRNIEPRFSGFSQSQSRSPSDRGSESGGDPEKSKELEEAIAEVMKAWQEELEQRPSTTMRQALMEMIKSKTLYRSIDYIDGEGNYLDGYLIDDKSPQNWTQRDATQGIDLSSDHGFIAFKEFLHDIRIDKDGRTPSGRQESGSSRLINNSLRWTLISDVDAARDLNGEIVQPVIPVIHIWAVNRFFLRPPGESRRMSRFRPDDVVFMRLEINAREFFQKLVLKEEFETTTGGRQQAYVGLPNGDYFLHPDAGCILCSRSGSSGISWKKDFPELIDRLEDSDSDVFFDSAQDRVVAAQRIQLDQTNPDRQMILIRSVPMEDVLQAVTNIRRLTVFLVLIMMLIVVPATVWITRGFTRPIRALVAATDKIAEGDLETDIPVRAEDELGQLADSYEKMKARIRNMIQYLKDRQAVAESANKAKSTFLANMSHELRTPLNGILGYAQILKQNPDLTPKQAEGVNVILRSGEHLLSLINDILDLSKVEAGRMELHPTDFSLHDLLDNLSRIIELRARQKKIHFKLVKSVGLPDMVHGDDSRLRQILMNLLSNAVKFTDEGEVTMSASMRNGKIRFEVLDTGPGIPAEHIEAIFSPFQQVGRVDRMNEGTGLGLAISRKLTQMLGGELKVNSTVGKGSRFYFDIELPVASDSSTIARGDTTMFWMGPGARDSGKVEAARKAAKDHRKIVGYSGKPIKVMVVDDKTENRVILRELLAPLGFEVFEACDGEEAVQSFPEHNPDLILMDLRMPKCDGYQATRRIRSIESDVQPVIITISASAFATNRQDSLDAGATDFVPKPVRRSLLLDAIHQHLKLDWVFSDDDEITSEDSGEDGGSAPAGEGTRPDISGAVCARCIEAVDEMIDLARRGNLKGLDTRLNEATEQLPALKSFEAGIRPLVKGFKIKELNQLLQDIRTELETNRDAEGRPIDTDSGAPVTNDSTTEPGPVAT